jgi:hypothetical protein
MSRYGLDKVSSVLECILVTYWSPEGDRRAAPSGDSGLACGPSGYRGGGLPNDHQWTPQSHLEGMLRPSVFAGKLRARSCAACDPDLSKAHLNSGRVTQRSRCPLRAQSDVVDTQREMTRWARRRHSRVYDATRYDCPAAAGQRA